MSGIVGNRFPSVRGPGVARNLAASHPDWCKCGRRKMMDVARHEWFCLRCGRSEAFCVEFGCRGHG